MNTDRELMQQALEALKSCSSVTHYPVLQLTIKALRERLAQQEQQYPDNFIEALMYDVAKRDSEAQQCRTDGRCQYAIDHGAEGMGHCPKGECVMSAQPESEPTAWKKKGAFHFCNQPPVDVEKWIPLYKSHTQHWQTWTSLTDEEIETIHRSAWIQSTATLNDFARAIEAKLKEKNT